MVVADSGNSQQQLDSATLGLDHWGGDKIMEGAVSFSSIVIVCSLVCSWCLLCEIKISKIQWPS